MPKKYELLAIYNDCLAHGDDPLTAMNKIAMNSGVTRDDLLEMDRDLLGGFMHDAIESPYLVNVYGEHESSLLDDILNPKHDDFDSFGDDSFDSYNNSNSDDFDPFDF